MERQTLTTQHDFSINPIDLSPADLDRMAEAQRIKDDCRAALDRARFHLPPEVRMAGDRQKLLAHLAMQPPLPPGLCAYAPDPDADYDQGLRDGYLLGLNAAPPIRWMPKTVTARDQWIKLALVVVFIGGLTWLALL